MNNLQKVEASSLRTDLPNFKAGDTLKVYCRIKEGDKTRVQIFEGVVIGRHNDGIRSSFTVRKVSFNVGVERIFPLHSPSIEKIEVVSQGIVRRAKLYYVRNLFGKKARIRSNEYFEAEAPVATNDVSTTSTEATS